MVGRAGCALKIAIIGSRGYPSTYGGFETLVRELAPALRDRGHEVVVYGRIQGLKAVKSDVNGVTVRSTPTLESKSASTLTNGLTACADAARSGFDSVLVLNCANGLFLPLLKLAKIPTVVNVDGLEWQREKWGRLAQSIFKLGARMCLRFADTLIFDGHALGEFWRREFNADGIVIPYGATPPTEVSDDALRRFSLQSGRYVLVVARLVPENNLEMLLDAWGRRFAGYRLVLVGSTRHGSKLMERVERFAERDDVLWLRHIDDQELLGSLWAHSGVYFHGHSVGGTNPGLLQAMAHGCAVVAWDTPFNREVLGESGVFVSDSVEIQEVVANLLHDPDRSSALADQAVEIVQQRYRWNDVLSDYVQVLEQAGR